MTFDCAVNMGLQSAVKILQTVLKVEVDGIAGPETVSAAKLYLPRAELVARVVELRLRWYEDLARKSERHAKYLHGWRLRCCRLLLEAGAWRGL